MLNKGKKSLKNGDFPAALLFFNAGLEIEESNADLLGARCVTYMNISKAKMAEKDAHKLISLYPNNSQVRICFKILWKIKETRFLG